jgi:hypothetical protein
VEFLPGGFSLLCAQRRHIRICFGLPVHRSLVRPSVVPRDGVTTDIVKFKIQSCFYLGSAFRSLTLHSPVSTPHLGLVGVAHAEHREERDRLRLRHHVARHHQRHERTQTPLLYQERCDRPQPHGQSLGCNQATAELESPTLNATKTVATLSLIQQVTGGSRLLLHTRATFRLYLRTLNHGLTL